MCRPRCPRCHGWLMYAEEDGAIRVTCLMCARRFALAPARQPALRA